MCAGRAKFQPAVSTERIFMRSGKPNKGLLDFQIRIQDGYQIMRLRSEKSSPSRQIGMPTKRGRHGHGELFRREGSL